MALVNSWELSSELEIAFSGNASVIDVSFLGLSFFGSVVADLSIVILSDIYAAREADTGEVNAAMMADRIAGTGKKVSYIKEFERIAEFLDKNAESGDLIITMGAGDIYKVGEMFLEARKKRAVS